jgi:hypothetical protein
MKKHTILSIFLFCFVLVAQGAGASEKKIKKAKIPNISMAPSLKSIMSNLNKDKEKEKKEIETNGYLLDNGNIAVDDLAEPKCIFYGNYNDGSGDANQFFDIDTIVFQCN